MVAVDEKELPLTVFFAAHFDNGIRATSLMSLARLEARTPDRRQHDSWTCDSLRIGSMTSSVTPPANK